MTKKFLILFFVLSSFTFIHGQTYTGTGGPIFDDNNQSVYTIDVQGLSPNVLSPNHGLINVCINLTHTWDSDLDIRLIAPDGTNMMLSASMGYDGDNYENTCFDMQAADHIINGVAPFTGSYRPFTSLGDANNGHSGNGIWTLRILDQFPYADVGELFNWSVTFGSGAAGPFTLGSSKFPIILLTTDNITIPNEPKVDGKIKVIDNGPGLVNHLTDAPVYNGYMGIEVRGASSQSFPKKNFGMETRDSLGGNFEVPLLGLPKEEDWILYAPFTDKSFIRDALTYKLGNDEGRYAPRTKFVELFINGDYQGVYCIEEKIKRDKNRVDIAKLTASDTTGEKRTGGYILKVDRDDGDGTYFVSGYLGTDQVNEVRIVYEDPAGPDLQQPQKNYIQNFFHGFESSLYGDDFQDAHKGYRRYLDVPSTVDYFLINELGHNVDGYRLSTYMYKDRDSKDSLLHFGPLWDFNLCYGNVNYCNSQNLEGWAYNDSGACGNTPLWWPRLLQDTFFQNKVQCRYQSLRQNVLSDASILHYVDSMATVFAPVQSRNYARWPILGVYVWPNNFVGQTYQEEIDYMKTWITGRLAWMDDNLPGVCTTTATNVVV
ncbi:MAG: CotH kinase family protein, partial [Saprospiraceae bacterium]